MTDSTTQSRGGLILCICLWPVKTCLSKEAHYCSTKILKAGIAPFPTALCSDSRYTCYGCHERTAANIRREHIEEGIRKFANCVECHRGEGGEVGEGQSKNEHND